MHTASQNSRFPELTRGRVVLVFTDDAASGATLGYFGSVVGIDEGSVADNVDRPDRWKYVVYIPYLNANYAIRARHLIATSDCDLSSGAIGPACEIQFEGDPDVDDNVAISGRYRTAGRGRWNAFRFTKTDDAVPNYKLSMPLSCLGGGGSDLSYCVPSHEVLDRGFVFQALGDVCGEQDWQDVTNKRRPT